VKNLRAPLPQENKDSRGYFSSSKDYFFKFLFLIAFFSHKLYANMEMGIQKRAQREKLSQLRQSLGNLSNQIRDLIRPFFSDKPVIRGSVYELKRKCGKPGCRCMEGQLHSSMVLSSSERGRTRLRIISLGSLLEVKRKVQRYQALRRSRSQLVQTFKEMLQVLDEMEESRREEVSSGESG
jgi:hypothetical protein